MTQDERLKIADKMRDELYKTFGYYFIVASEKFPYPSFSETNKVIAAVLEKVGL